MSFTFKLDGFWEKVCLVGFRETQGGGGGVHGACLPGTGVWRAVLRGDPPPLLGKQIGCGHG